MRIVVIGARSSGKSTLFSTWLGQWESPDTRKGTGDPISIGTIKLDVRRPVLCFNPRMTFRRCVDVSGGDSTMDTFRKGIVNAKAVVYLVDARVLADEEKRRREEYEHRVPIAQSDDWQRVLMDASRIRRHIARAQHVVLVVTHTDQDPRTAFLSPAAYNDLLRDQLREVAGDIRGSSGFPPVKMVFGSMETRENATSLAAAVASNLIDPA